MDYRFTWDGDEIRVVIWEDVIALPGEGWSLGGFGSSIDTHWLLGNGKLPGSARRKRALAEAIVAALRTHHEGAATRGDGVKAPRGPLVRCPTCRDSGCSGFIPSPG